MPISLGHHVSFAVFLSITQLALATPMIAYPINSQLPPVAYVSQPFEFTFSPSTFTSDVSEISYSLSDQPDWLSLDATARRLSGTPTSADITAPTFQLIAADSGGQATSSVTLVVRQERTLFSGAGIQAQLAQAGNVSSPNTLLLHPSVPFDFTVIRDVFRGTSTQTEFYAISSDGSPLPSWLQFDRESLRLSGVSPLLLELNPTSQTFAFVLVASDVPGFSESSIEFSVLVSDHLLVFAHPQLNFTISRGEELNTGPLLDQVYIDGTNISRDQIVSVNTNAPVWVSCDGDDLLCSGTAPDGLKETAFLLSLTGLNTNTANVTIAIQVSGQSDVDQKDLGSLTVDAGIYFSYTINESVLSVQNATVDTNLGRFSSWLSFTATNLTLHGLVPTVAIDQTQNITFTAFHSERLVEAFLFLAIVEPPARPTTTVSGSGTGPTDGATAPPRNQTPSDPARHLASLILAIVLPILAAVIVICFVGAWLRKRRKQRTTHTRTKNSGNTSHEPVHEFESEIGSIGPLSEAAEAGDTANSSARSAPHLELPWAPDSLGHARKHWSKRSRPSQRSAAGPSWDDLINFERNRYEIVPPESPTALVSHNPQRTASLSKPPSLRDSLRRVLRRSGQPTRENALSSHSSKPRGSVMAQAISLPKRAHGAGHGAGGDVIALSPDPRSSWQATLGTMPVIDSRPSTIMLDSFPAPPSHMSLNSAAATTKSSPQRDSRPTLRIVDSHEADSFEAARQRYHAQRTRDRLEGAARFSNLAYGTLSKSRSTLEASGRSTRTDLHKPPGREANASVRRSTPLGFRGQGNRPAVTRGEIYPAGSEQFDSIGHGVSRASSHQFDSAVSSDSQWEDENLVADESAAGEVYWQSRPEPGSKASPRPPFEPHDTTQAGLPGVAAGSGSRRPRLADQRRHVSIEATGQDNPSRSHKGSLRFI